jgi:hypothetical protein
MITKTETRLEKRKQALVKKPVISLGQYIRVRRTT